MIKGDKVRCIKEFKDEKHPTQDAGKLGEIYTIKAISPMSKYMTVEELFFVNMPDISLLVAVSRFEKV